MTGTGKPPIRPRFRPKTTLTALALHPRARSSTPDLPNGRPTATRHCPPSRPRLRARPAPLLVRTRSPGLIRRLSRSPSWAPLSAPVRPGFHTWPSLGTLAQRRLLPRLQTCHRAVLNSVLRLPRVRLQTLVARSTGRFYLQCPTKIGTRQLCRQSRQPRARRILQLSQDPRFRRCPHSSQSGLRTGLLPTTHRPVRLRVKHQVRQAPTHTRRASARLHVQDHGAVAPTVAGEAWTRTVARTASRSKCRLRQANAVPAKATLKFRLQRCDTRGRS